MRRDHGTVCGLAVMLTLGIAVVGCKKRAPRAPTPPPAAADCPGPEKLGKLLADTNPGFRSACVRITDVGYWMAAALTHTPAGPRLLYLSGGLGDRVMVFDVDTPPPDILQRHTQGADEVEVRIRPGKSARSLVRLGVIARRGKPAGSEELATLLQLVAHAPPQVMWSGAADQTTVTPDCVSERVVEFEMPFGRRLDMTTFTRARPPAGVDASADGACASGPGFQESLPWRPVKLAAGRSLAFEQ